MESPNSAVYKAQAQSLWGVTIYILSNRVSIYITDYVKIDAIVSAKVKPFRVELVRGWETTANSPRWRHAIIIVVIFFLNLISFLYFVNGFFQIF